MKIIYIQVKIKNLKKLDIYNNLNLVLIFLIIVYKCL